MKVYVVANLKGGVGKTTTTVNVAYTFSEMGGRVLVIDLDPQCNCTRFFAKGHAEMGLRSRSAQNRSIFAAVSAGAGGRFARNHPQRS